MSAVVVLLHSPLVGALTWRDVGAVLRGRGHRVVVPDLSGAVRSGPPHLPALAAAIRAAVTQDAAVTHGGGVTHGAVTPGGGARQGGGVTSMVLVGHSAAGPLLPGLAAELGRAVPGPGDPPGARSAPGRRDPAEWPDRAGGRVRVDAVIFVDAVMPYPRESWWDRAPRPLVDRLGRLARDGFLPPWHEWFAPEDLAAVLPDRGLRDAFTAELRPVPMSFFTERLPAVRWDGPAAYLLLSEGYRPDAGQARAAGLAVVEQVDHHLAMLTAPGRTADSVERLLTLVRDAAGAAPPASPPPGRAT